jgi:hypothetical protein
MCGWEILNAGLLIVCNHRMKDATFRGVCAIGVIFFSVLK